jgi:glycosyltransferase involved in cell wall biosynthesis
LNCCWQTSVPMVIVQITTDNREPFREYHKSIPWFGTAPEALFQGFTAIPDVKVHVIGCTQRPMSGSPEKLASNIWFHSLVVPKIGWMRTGYQGCVRAIRRKIREIAPDIVHGQGTERECALGAVFSGRPNVLTVHGNMRLVAVMNRARPFSYQWLAARLERFTIPRVEGVVCISRYTRDAVSSLARRTWVVPNAVDQSFFDVTPAPDAPAVILCVGNISHRKNQISFIRALDPLRRQVEFAVVFLGGCAKDDPYSAEFFEKLKSRSWCRYEGFADREKVKEYFRNATILALPSLEDNCPMVVLEAMAARLPVVAANVGGVPDLVNPGKTGLLCDPRDATSMRMAVEQLLSDAALREQLAAAANAEAHRRFHPLEIVSRHLEIYREVLGRR